MQCVVRAGDPTPDGSDTFASFPQPPALYTDAGTTAMVFRAYTQRGKTGLYWARAGRGLQLRTLIETGDVLVPGNREVVYLGTAAHAAAKSAYSFYASTVNATSQGDAYDGIYMGMIVP